MSDSKIRVMTMLLVILFTIGSAISDLSDQETKEVYKSLKKLQSGTISPGAGFSSDSQQVAPQVCFNATAGPLGQSQSTVSLDQSQTFA